MPVAPARRELLELRRVDPDGDPVVVDDLPDWRVIDDVVGVHGAARDFDVLGGGATLPVGDRFFFLAVLGVDTRDFFVPGFVVLGNLRDASPVLCVGGLHLLHERLRDRDEEQGRYEREQELPPKYLLREEHQQDDDDDHRDRRRTPDDHSRLLLLLLEDVDVVVLAGGEVGVRLRGGDDRDLDHRTVTHEQAAGEGRDDEVVFAVEVDELLLIPEELLALTLHRDHQVLVEAHVEVRVGLLDPGHERAAALVAVATFHDGGVDVLEAGLVLLGDLGLLADHLPHGVVLGLVGFLLGRHLCREGDLAVAVGEVHAADDDDEAEEDGGRREGDFLGDVHGNFLENRVNAPRRTAVERANISKKTRFCQ